MYYTIDITFIVLSILIVLITIGTIWCAILEFRDRRYNKVRKCPTCGRKMQRISYNDWRCNHCGLGVHHYVVRKQ